MLQGNCIKNNNCVRAALYARVSSEQQAAAGTIDSQIEAVAARMAADGLAPEPELRFVDEGVSGATLIRPALEKLRDAAAAGAIDRLYVLCPDRLSRTYAHQMVLIDELHRCGVEVVFVNHELGKTPEDNLLLQVQSMIGEYERAKILERSRRGKLHAARAGKISILGRAPFGYRYSPADGACPAQYSVHLPEAAVVRQIFQQAAVERMSLRQVCKTLEKQGVLSPTGNKRWSCSTLKGMLGNPAYKGAASYGKTCHGPMRPRLRVRRGGRAIPRRGQSVYAAPPQQWIAVAVPAIVEESIFDAAAAQQEENRKRRRQRASGPASLLAGLLVCSGCGYACYGSCSGCPSKVHHRYYRCSASQPSRCHGQRLCEHKPVRQDQLDEAVWNDVRQFLADPARVQHELQRRLEGDEADAQQTPHKMIEAQVAKVRRGIARLIDAYEQGLVDKAEFEPRIKAARQHLVSLEQQFKQQVDQQARQREMKLVIDNFQSFSANVMAGLDQADWQTRRKVITTLIKQVELEKEHVKIVYRVDLCPFDQRPERGNAQHCTARLLARLSRRRVTEVTKCYYSSVDINTLLSIARNLLRGHDLSAAI